MKVFLSSVKMGQGKTLVEIDDERVKLIEPGPKEDPEPVVSYFYTPSDGYMEQFTRWMLERLTLNESSFDAYKLLSLADPLQRGTLAPLIAEELEKLVGQSFQSLMLHKDSSGKFVLYKESPLVPSPHLKQYITTLLKMHWEWFRGTRTFMYMDLASLGPLNSYVTDVRDYLASFLDKDLGGFCLYRTQQHFDTFNLKAVEAEEVSDEDTVKDLVHRFLDLWHEYYYGTRTFTTRELDFFIVAQDDEDDRQELIDKANGYLHSLIGKIMNRAYSVTFDFATKEYSLR